MHQPVDLTFDEYRQLVEQSPILIWRADLSMGCDYFNHRWLEFTGRTLDQEVGNGWAEGVHADDFDRCLEIYQTSFKQRRSFEMEYRLRRHDGVYRWILDRGGPFWDDQGQFAGYIGSCVDVTERIEAQAALEQARKEELRRLQEMLPICSRCHKVRDDHGYWSRLEKYFREHSGVIFTHGLCPDCVREYYTELDHLQPSQR